MKNLIRKVLKESEPEWFEGVDSLEPLQYKERKIYHVNYRDLEKFIEKVYGKKIHIPAMLESNNDTTHEFDTSDDWGVEDEINGWLKEDEWIWLGDILSDLANNKKIIPSGEWMVRVYW